MLTSRELACYKFNDEGMGCRWWCEVVMRMLENEDTVENGTALDLVEGARLSPAAMIDHRRSKVKGSFYQPSRNRVFPFSESLTVVE